MSDEAIAYENFNEIKFKIQMLKGRKLFWSFGFWSFEFVSNFVLRI